MHTDKTIVITYNLNEKQISDSFYAKYGVLDETFVQEYNNSISANMRRFIISFDHEKMSSNNVEKHETNVYYYRDIYQIKKITTGYLFYINKITFYFIQFSDFDKTDLAFIDELLEPYYKKYQETSLAIIEHYELNKNRVFIGAKKANQASTQRIFSILILLALVFMIFEHSVQSIVISLIAICIFYVCYNVSYQLMAKNIVKSTHETLKHSRIVFYSDKMAFINKNKIGTTTVNYGDFYKIKKIKQGYLFQLQRYSLFVFFFDEFTPEQRQQLEENLKNYKNYDDK